MASAWRPERRRGAEYAPAIAAILDLVDVEILTGQGDPGYSGFRGAARSRPYLEQVFDDAHIDDVDIVGLATDFAVRATAIDASGHADRTVTVFSTYVVGSVIRPLWPGSRDARRWGHPALRTAATGQPYEALPESDQALASLLSDPHPFGGNGVKPAGHWADPSNETFVRSAWDVDATGAGQRGGRS